MSTSYSLVLKYSIEIKTCWIFLNFIVHNSLITYMIRCNHGFKKRVRRTPRGHLKAKAAKESHLRRRLSTPRQGVSLGCLRQWLKSVRREAVERRTPQYRLNSLRKWPKPSLLLFCKPCSSMVFLSPYLLLAYCPSWVLFFSCFLCIFFFNSLWFTRVLYTYFIFSLYCKSWLLAY